MAQKHKAEIARKLLGHKHLMESPEQRALLAATLAYSSRPEMKRLANDCLSPSHDGTSFASLCDQLNLTWKDIEREITSIRRSEGFIRISQHIPGLMEQSALDAQSRHEPCSRCKTTGKVEVKDKDPEVCPSCHGKGDVYLPGEVERLKLVFETFGLIGKGSININNHLDLRNLNAGESMEDLYSSVAPILDGKVIE